MTDGNVTSGFDDEPERIRIPESECKTFFIVTYIGVFGLICFLGIIGNALSFIILRRYKRTETTGTATFLLTVLAVADNSFLLITGVIQILTTALICRGTGLGDQPYFPYLQTFVWSLVYITQMAPIYVIVLVAFNRYIAICHPFRIVSMKTVKIQVITAIIFVIVYNIPRFFEYDLSCSHLTSVTESTFENVTSVSKTNSSSCGTTLKSNEFYNVFYENILYCVFVFLGPFLLILFFNGTVISELMYPRVKDVEMSLNERQERRNITRVMVIIVLVFLVTQTPAFVNQILYIYYSLQPDVVLLETRLQCGSVYFYFYHISNVIVAAGSSVNFVIYCVCRRNFRGRLWDLLLCHPERRLSTTSTYRSSNATATTHLSSSVASKELKTAN
jgi:hypothetical protein